MKLKTRTHLLLILPMFFHFLTFQKGLLAPGDKVQQLRSHKVYIIDSLMHRVDGRSKNQIFYHAHDENGVEANYLPYRSIKKIDG
jgi:hypothetical protein